MTERKSYSSNKFKLELPYLIEVQKASYEQFLQKNTPIQDRLNVGLERVFQDIFPITDIKELNSLKYEGYNFGVPKYGVAESRERGLTYSIPLYANLSLHRFEKDGENTRLKEEIKNNVFICDLPIMTDNGTFIINGAERVVVSQLHRSPGVSFDEEILPNGRSDFKSRIIPHRGVWVEFLTNADALYFVIDRKKKIPASVLLRCIGFETTEEILDLFYKNSEVIEITKVDPDHLMHRIIRKDIIDHESGELILEANTVIDDKNIERLLESGVNEVSLIAQEEDSLLIHNTLNVDKCKNKEEALKQIYLITHRSQEEAPNLATAEAFFAELFFEDRRYDLGEVGRYRLNAKVYNSITEKIIIENKKSKPSLGTMTMTEEDFLAIIIYMVGLYDDAEYYSLDDIDHLGNRRTRSVGELLANQMSIGLSRMSRVIRENLFTSPRDADAITPRDLVNTRMVSSVVQAFFGSGQLSQFMDQMNPLAELTHKRRLSALGPGGLSRERASYEARDVHYTHYGRLCPIETPEGPNIGLISSLSTFAIVNSMGFIEMSYRKVTDGVVDIKGEPIYLSAEEEEDQMIAQATVEVDAEGKIVHDKVIARMEGDFPVVEPSEIHYTDVAPNQIASISASLIPFLEHDDANRALMGSNMMRQAVPLLRPQAPIVGTGLERRVASDSRVLINAEGDGVVEYVDANEIIIKYDRTEDEAKVSFESDTKTYPLVKFRKTNQGTSINLKPIVVKGDKVKKGQVLCEGYATEKGELALGINLKVAFMPWKGYNFEDAIVISERVVREDIFTSIHIDEYSLEVRDTKLG